jgi:hypothetical protein
MLLSMMYQIRVGTERLEWVKDANSAVNDAFFEDELFSHQKRKAGWRVGQSSLSRPVEDSYFSPLLNR